LFEASVLVLTDSVVKVWTEVTALVTEVPALVLTKNLAVCTGKLLCTCKQHKNHLNHLH